MWRGSDDVAANNGGNLGGNHGSNNQRLTNQHGASNHSGRSICLLCSRNSHNALSSCALCLLRISCASAQSALNDNGSDVAAR
jgi:hypothetical protein